MVRGESRWVHAGRRRADAIARRFGAELRLARTTSGLSQRALATMVGVSQSFVSRVESGGRRADWPTACALCEATGHDLSIRLFPTRSVSLRDSGQLAVCQTIAAASHPSRRTHLEHPVAPGDLRAADLLLAGTTDALHIEVERRLVDLQAQLRSAQVKRSMLAQQMDIPVHLVLAVLATARNRAILAALAPVLSKALPRTSAEVWRAIRTGEPLGADGLLIVRPAPPR